MHTVYLPKHLYTCAFDYVDTIQTSRYVMYVLTCSDPSIVCQALIHRYNTICIRRIWWKGDATKTIFVNGRSYPSVKSFVCKLFYRIGESKTHIMTPNELVRFKTRRVAFFD